MHHILLDIYAQFYFNEKNSYAGGCTVSWRIRIFNCIEEVPRFFFSIEFNSAFQISNYLQLNSTPYTIYLQLGLTRAWVQILDGTLPWGSLWTELYCNKEFFKQASTTVGNTLWMLYIMNVWMKEKNFKKSGGGRTYNHVFTSPLLNHLHQHIFFLWLNKVLY